ncbi:MAG: hypothetical protein K1X65_19540 [Caldilineales bacterium]|nr:hypothetical protein [Caldilineales bacterium]MCW5859525.1 hypothetical protein [Caldilineales bacterium]
MRLLAADPILYLALAVGLTLSMVIGFVTRQQTAMPVIGGLLVWPFLLWSLRHARVDVAVRFVVFWAALVFLISLVAGRALGQMEAQAAVPGSTQFIASQMLWLGGQGGASEPAASWLPAFLRRTGLLLAGGALTAGLLPLIVAARELSILGLWTANLLDAASPLAVVAGLPPWTLAEIVAWAALSVFMAEPLVTGNVHGLLTRDRRRLALTGLLALLLAFLLHLLLPSLLASPLRSLIR